METNERLKMHLHNLGQDVLVAQMRLREFNRFVRVLKKQGKDLPVELLDSEFEGSKILAESWRVSYGAQKADDEAGKFFEESAKRLGL